jgi:hypothetical protein
MKLKAKRAGGTIIPSKKTGQGRVASVKHLKELREAVILQIGEAEAKAPSTPEALQVFLYRHLEFLEKNPEAGEILYGRADPADKKRAERRVSDLRKPILSSLEKLFFRAKSERALRAEIDPAMAAIHFLGVIQMAFTFWMIGGRKPALQNIGDSLYAQFLEGIAS